MTQERSAITQTIQIGKETVENTAVAATKRLAALSIETGIQINFSKFRSMGKRYPSLSVPGKKWTGLTGSGKLTYTEILYLLSSIFKDVTPTTPGGGTLAREWLYEQSTTNEETVATYTIQQGSGVRAHQAAGAFFSGMTLQGDPDTVDISSLEGFARAISDNTQMSTNEVQSIVKTGTVSSGTFTLTVVNPATSVSVESGAIDFDSTAAEVQTALEAMSNVAVGDVVCTGGPLPATAVVIEFRGEFRQRDVASMVVDDTLIVGGGSIDLTVVTPGVAPTELALIPVIPEHCSWYADDTYGALGGTLLTRVLRWSVPISSMRAPLYTVNAANLGSMAAKVDSEPTYRITLFVEADTQGMAFYTTAQLGDTKFLRFNAVGDEIESGQDYELQFDFAAKIDSLAPFTNEQGVYAYEVGFVLVHDGGWGKSQSLLARNGITAL